MDYQIVGKTLMIKTDPARVEEGEKIVEQFKSNKVARDGMIMTSDIIIQTLMSMGDLERVIIDGCQIVVRRSTKN